MEHHDVWGEVRRHLSEVSDKVDSALRMVPGVGAFMGPELPKVNVYETDEDLIVRAEVPGMGLEDFDISVSGDTLTVEGSRATGEEMEGGWYHRRERERGRFSRAVRLPAAVDGDRAEATYVAGVLSVTLPLKEAARPKEIPVRVVEG